MLDEYEWYDDLRTKETFHRSCDDFDVGLWYWDSGQQQNYGFARLNATLCN